jgi:hypothetical protein
MVKNLTNKLNDHVEGRDRPPEKAFGVRRTASINKQSKKNVRFPKNMLQVRSRRPQG